MGKNRFSKETIEHLKGTQYIKKITETQIIFTNEFKLIVVEKHSKGLNNLTPNEYDQYLISPKQYYPVPYLSEVIFA